MYKIPCIFTIKLQAITTIAGIFLVRYNQRNGNKDINIFWACTYLGFINIFIRTQNQVYGLMAIGELISRLQQEREGLIFRIISNGTIENGYYIVQSHINELQH